jgi:hypothetical protein
MVAPTLPAIRRKVLGDQLETRLRALPGDPHVTVYRGEVPKSPPRVPDSDRVAPYVVLFDGTGLKDLEPSLCGTHEDLRWTPSITIAAGFPLDCIQTIDRVYAWVFRWSPTVNGLAFGQLIPPPGFDPGPPRNDTTVSPVRFFVSTSWQLDATT